MCESACGRGHTSHARPSAHTACVRWCVRACSAWHEAMRVWEAEAVTKKVSVAKEALLCVKGDILAKAGMLQAAVAAYVRHLPRPHGTLACSRQHR